MSRFVSCCQVCADDVGAHHEEGTDQVWPASQLRRLETSRCRPHVLEADVRPICADPPPEVGKLSRPSSRNYLRPPTPPWHYSRPAHYPSPPPTPSCDPSAASGPSPGILTGFAPRRACRSSRRGRCANRGVRFRGYKAQTYSTAGPVKFGRCRAAMAVTGNQSGHVAPTRVPRGTLPSTSLRWDSGKERSSQELLSGEHGAGAKQGP